MEAQFYRPALKSIVLPPRAEDGTAGHKRARTGKPRTILLTDRCIAIVERLSRKYPSGPIFRPRCARGPGGVLKMRQGLAENTLYRACDLIRKKTGLTNFVPYSFRHTFAFRWLRAGKPIAALATVLGTSVTLIEETYGHMGDQHDYLHGLLDQTGS